MQDASAFRRQVARVSRVSTNELRGVVIDRLKERCGEVDIHPDSVQFFAGKAKEVQVRHYTPLATQKWHDLVHTTLQL